MQVRRRYLVSNPNRALSPYNRTFSRARLQSVGRNICAKGRKIPCNESIHWIKAVNKQRTPNVPWY